MKIELHSDNVAYLGPFGLTYESNFEGYQIWRAVSTGALYIVDQTTLEIVRGIQLKNDQMEVF